MGKEITERGGESNRIVTAEPTEKRTRDTGNRSAETTETRSEGRTRGSGSGRGSGNTEEKEKLSGLAILTEEEKTEYQNADEETRKKIIKRAKARERYRQQKAQGKPKKVKKKEEEPAIDVSQINLIIAGISSAVASRPGCAHWLLTEKEINSITVPLAGMMAESDIFSKMGEYSNQIALVTACVTVFAPRILITAQQTKERKKVERTGNKTDTTVKNGRITGEKKNSNSKSDRPDERKPSTSGENNGESVPFYGMPIC